MEEGPSSCESTAPSVSPLPLRGGRRRPLQLVDDLWPYKLGAILLSALAAAGVSPAVELVEPVVRVITRILGSAMAGRFPQGERLPSEGTQCPGNVSSENAHWNAGLDRIFIDAMLEHETSWAGSTFTVPGWQMIMTRFNHVACLHYTKAQLLYRWKNLKKDYAAYIYLRNKSGWGWDGIYNRPIPPSESAWFELPDRYRKYRNKPFLYFGDIQRFLSKDIATGVHAISSRPPRDTHGFGASTSFSPPSQRELNFDENLDECMQEPGDEFEPSEDVTPTPSRKRSTTGGRAMSKKTKSGPSRTVAGQEVLNDFLRSLSEQFNAGKNGPEDVALAACREIGLTRQDLDADEIDKIAERLDTAVGRNAFMIARSDPEKLKKWIDRILSR